jgi:hypothetical protein
VVTAKCCLNSVDQSVHVSLKICINFLAPRYTYLITLRLVETAGDKIEKNELGGACSADGVGERRVQGFGGET